MTKMPVKVIDTDNRDPYTTILVLDNGLCIEVNPLALMINMFQNNIDEEQCYEASRELIEVIDKYLNVTELEPE